MQGPGLALDGPLNDVVSISYSSRWCPNAPRWMEYFVCVLDYFFITDFPKGGGCVIPIGADPVP